MSEWVEGKYSTWRRTLDGGLSLSVSYDATRSKGSDEPPYVAYVGDRRLLKRFDSKDAAIAKAEAVAMSIFKKAIADLATDTKEPR